MDAVLLDYNEGWQGFALKCVFFLLTTEMI